MNRSRIAARRAVSVGLVLLSVAVLGCGEEPAAGPGGAASVAPAPAPAATPQSTVTEGPEVKVPDGFPAELVYGGSAHERAATTPNELHLASVSTDAASKVVAFYQGALPRSGFKPVSLLNPDSATTIVVGNNGPRVFSATVRATGTGCRIELAHKLQEEM